MNINDIFLESYRNRCFENKVAEYLDKKIVNPPVYLSQGTEHIPVILRHALEDSGVDDYAIFPQHRCHSYFLTFSDGDWLKKEAMRSLRDELCGKTSGCGNGMTGSASLHIPDVMFGHDGLLGSNAPIACGYAQATGKTTICILGDAACEEDYVLAAMGYAATHKLPILFLIENNGLSILTDIPTRRSWSVLRVATSLGLGSVQINDSLESSWSALYSILLGWLPLKQPCLVESIVCRHRWHAGSGNDGPPKWDSLNEQKDLFLSNFYPTDPMFIIEESVNIIWDELNV